RKPLPTPWNRAARPPVTGRRALSPKGDVGRGPRGGPVPGLGGGRGELEPEGSSTPNRPGPGVGRAPRLTAGQVAPSAPPFVSRCPRRGRPRRAPAAAAGPAATARTSAGTRGAGSAPPRRG